MLVNVLKYITSEILVSMENLGLGRNLKTTIKFIVANSIAQLYEL